MGFSLQAFMDKLEDILADTRTDPARKLELLAQEVQYSKNYARECGALE